MKNSLPPKFPNAKQTLQFALHWEQTLIATQVSLSKLVLGAGALIAITTDNKANGNGS